MRNYVVYDGNGTILRWGVCPSKDLGLQAKNGEFVGKVEKMESGLDITHKMVTKDGVPKIIKRKG